MSDSGPIYVAEPRGQDEEPGAVTLIVEYRDVDDFVRDYESSLSSGRAIVQSLRDFTIGAPVTLVLTFPGLIRPLRIPGVIDAVGEAHGPGRSVEIGFMGYATAKVGLDAHVARIKARDPDYVVRAICVLVVEDNPHCAKLIQEGLRLAGKRAFGNQVAFDVPIASNAADAFTFLHSRPIDVLITDIYLGGVSGTTVIEHVRADAVLKSMPVIAISAGDDATREAALQAGANVFLPKPVRLRQIVGTVGEVLALEQVAWR
jgi:CheY-like chemotaxis protein